MSQHDYNIANQGFSSFRSDLNNALSAIQTCNSGTSRPTGAVAGQIWLDTTSATSPTLKYYDGADDISLATIDHSANTVNWLDSNVSVTGLTTTATGTVITLSDTANTSTVNLIIDNQKEVRFRETTANGTNYIGLKAPASVSADLTYTLPATDGTAGQFLSTNGSGVLSFATAGLTGATSTATGTVLTLSDTQNVASVNVILDNEKALRFREATANGTNFVGLKAPTTLSADTTYTLPSADGTSGQVLQTNGSGVLSFSSPSSDYVLLATTDASSSSSISFDGYFSSTYKNYRVIFTTIKKSTSSQLYLRVRKSNADQTSANYRYAHSRPYRSSGAGGVDYLTGWNVTYTELEWTNQNGTNARTSGFIDIFDPLNTDGWKSIMHNSFNMQNDDELDVLSGGIIFTQTGALSGVTFYPSSGNITSGNFKLYGIK